MWSMRNSDAKKQKQPVCYYDSVFFLAVSAGCASDTDETDGHPSEEELLTEEPARPAVLPEEPAEPEKSPAEELLEQMTLEEKVYQMFFVTPEQLTGVGTATAAGETTKKALEDYPVGGIIYFAKKLEDREQTVRMLNHVQSYSEIPLFLGVDEEGGTVSRVAANGNMGTTVFPDMLSVGSSGDSGKAYDVGYTIGTECMELGFNLDFAPVADVYFNSANKVIGSRAFSTEAETVAEMVEACVKGFQDAGMLCTLKHFPEHGDTLTDSHYGAAATEKTLEELRTEEFLPFERGIEAGADFVMVGHILTPRITDATPATLSEEVISVLRDELGFEGVIITDAMNMGAITEYYSSGNAAIAAIEAGIDMILDPADFHAAAEGVFSALESGILTEDRIDESVLRILQIKQDGGLLEAR